MSTSPTATTCMVRVSDQHWRNSEVSLGARSLLVRAVDGSAPVEWLPYDDVSNVTDVDDPTVDGGFIEVTARDGRRLSMQLDPQILASLLAALSESSTRPDETTLRPAEFGIGAVTEPAPHHSTAPPDESLAAPPPSAAPSSPVEHVGYSSPPISSGSRRWPWVLLGGVVVVVLVGLGMLVLLGGGDSDPDGLPTTPTTDAPDIDATPEPDARAQTTTTVVTDPGDDGPESALTVEVLDVAVDTTGADPAIYLAFATTNETLRNVSAYGLELALSAIDAQDQEFIWPVQSSCGSPLVAEGSRTGNLADQAPGADLDSLIDCRVGAWPLEGNDAAQRAFADAIATGATWRAEVTVVTVEFTDGTVLE